MKTLGMIGGLGWESSALYYRVLNAAIRHNLGGFHSCRVILDSLDFDAFARARRPEHFEEVRRQLVASARRLEVAGAQWILMACNTVHRFAPSVCEATTVPFLHIADALGERLVRDGHRSVGLLGTLATMEGAFYRKRLEREFGLEVLVPERTERNELNTLILRELQLGDDPRRSAGTMDRFIEGLAHRGASAIALACTELGMVYGSSEVPIIERALPAYDTAIIHALAAAERALDDD